MDAKQSGFAKYRGLLLAVLMLFTKYTKILVVLKAVKFTKPLVTLVSLLISTIAYGIYLGPWFGIGLVAMIFIHEMGHVIALQLKGINTPGPVFIPFLGAAIFVPKFDDRDTEAYVGYGGPLLGTIAALACFLAWYLTEKTSEILLLVSYVGLFLNIFNLIPLSPLDGGRVTQAIGGWLKYAGLSILLAYSFATREPQLMIIWVLVLDAFSLPLWVRPTISAVISIMMAALMLLGFSSQPFYLDILDCIIVTMFTGAYVMRDKLRNLTGEDASDDTRLYPRPSVRGKWAVCYFGLCVILALAIVVQAPFLPHGVKKHSESLSGPPTLVQ